MKTQAGLIVIDPVDDKFIRVETLFDDFVLRMIEWPTSRVV